jgi:HlyD family secretion protein
MFTRLRNLIILAILVIAVAAFIRFRVLAQAAGGRGGGTSLTQDTSVVDRGEVTITVSATGPIQANQTVSLSFPISGKVATINVNEGDHVRKGQTIATLNTQAALDALTLAQAKVAQQQVALRQLTEKPRQVDINVAQAALDMANASLKSAMSGPDQLQTQINALNVEVAKNQLWQIELQRDADNNRKAQLQSNPRTAGQAASLPSDATHNGQIASADYNVQIAQAQLDAQKSQGANVGSIASAQAQIVSAQNALNKLLAGGDKDDIARAEAQLQAAQAALDLAKDNLAKTALLAPFDGVVAQINLHLGEVPPASGAAVTMLDTSSFYVDVPIDETDVAKVAIGQPVTLTLDALPGVTVNGKVTRIAETPTMSGDVVTYTTHIEIDPAGQPLLSAMSATATITTSKVENVVRIRNRFVLLDRQSGRAFVNLRQPDGTFKEVQVVLGLRNDTFSEVKSGLSVGDVVGSIQAQQGGFGPFGRFGGGGNQGSGNNQGNAGGGTQPAPNGQEGAPSGGQGGRGGANQSTPVGGQGS